MPRQTRAAVLVFASLATSAVAQPTALSGPKMLIHGNYCGPGNNPQLPPIDALDAACARHDACTQAHAIPSRACNARLQREAEAISRDPRQSADLQAIAGLVATGAAMLQIADESAVAPSLMRPGVRQRCALESRMEPSSHTAELPATLAEAVKPWIDVVEAAIFGMGQDVMKVAAQADTSLRRRVTMTRELDGIIADARRASDELSISLDQEGADPSRSRREALAALDALITLLRRAQPNARAKGFGIAW